MLTSWNVDAVLLKAPPEAPEALQVSNVASCLAYCCHQVSDVMIWRPLFGLTKADVYDFAHTFGVPYFKVLAC